MSDATKFGFPYDPPYESQLELMQACYDTIASKSIGIFESPTGTGKTLSLLCGALSWLKGGSSTSDRKRGLPSWVKTPNAPPPVQKKFTKHLVDVELPDVVDDASVPPTKIYFCTRTHSQAGQVLSEFKKTAYSKVYHAIALGSRKHTCINEQVRPLTNVDAACSDLLSSQAQCAYYNRDKGADMSAFLVSSYRGHVVCDIEELVVRGKAHGACPYYGTKLLFKYFQLVVLPYQYIIQKEIRDSIGVDLKNSIVIFDEAHNIPEVINDYISVQLDNVLSSTKACLKYFSETSKCRIYNDEMRTVFEKLKVFLTQNRSESECVYTVNTFTTVAGLANVNTAKVAAAIDALLALKIDEYVAALLRPFSKFFRLLTTPKNEGRIFLHPSQQDCRIKFLSLNSNVAFDEMDADIRSIIFCGGTLSPISSFRTKLVANTSKMVVEKRFAHIIPEENLAVFTIGEINKKPVDFSYSRRNEICVQRFTIIVVS